MHALWWKYFSGQVIKIMTSQFANALSDKLWYK
jgi:hypothetical protein